jgi:hypothetical protein
MLETFLGTWMFLKFATPGRILNGRDIRGCATALLLDQSRGGTLYGAIRGIRVLALSWIWTLLKRCAMTRKLPTQVSFPDSFIG